MRVNKNRIRDIERTRMEEVEIKLYLVVAIVFGVRQVIRLSRLWALRLYHLSECREHCFFSLRLWLINTWTIDCVSSPISSPSFFFFAFFTNKANAKSIVCCDRRRKPQAHEMISFLLFSSSHRTYVPLLIFPFDWTNTWRKKWMRWTHGSALHSERSHNSIRWIVNAINSLRPPR